MRRTITIRVTPKFARFVREMQAREMLRGRKKPKIHNIVDRLIPKNPESYWRREYDSR